MPPASPFGVGMISQRLAPHCKRIVGVDISEKTVEYYNERVSNQGIPAEEMKAVSLELQGNDEELGGEKFDVIVVSLVFCQSLARCPI